MLNFVKLHGNNSLEMQLIGKVVPSNNTVNLGISARGAYYKFRRRWWTLIRGGRFIEGALI